MHDREWWHGSREPLTGIRPFLHVGSIEQATMRAGRSCHLTRVILGRGRVVRRRDTGSWRSRDLERTLRAGAGMVEYLNRYEGIPLDEVETALSACRSLDRLTDAGFRRLVPSATDSIIVLDPALATIVERRTATA